MLDYAMGREHFVDMGEQMHRHIYEINLAWGQMLDFYTDLNNARKEKDDSYAELNHIGEECIEPDEDHVKAIYDSAKQDEEEQKDEDTGNMLGDLSKEIENEKRSSLLGSDDEEDESRSS